MALLTYTVECFMAGNDRTGKRGLGDVVLWAVVDWRDKEDPYKFVHLDREKCMDEVRRLKAPVFPVDGPTNVTPCCPECEGEIVLMCTGDFWWHPKHIDDDDNLIFSGDRDDECNQDDIIRCLDCKLIWQKPKAIDFT